MTETLFRFGIKGVVLFSLARRRRRKATKQMLSTIAAMAATAINELLELIWQDFWKTMDLPLLQMTTDIPQWSRHPMNTTTIMM
jgi:hypothetical protein